MTPETHRKLGVIRIVAIVDSLLLLPLLYGLAVGNEDISPIVGPIHGVGFLGLLYLTVTGASEGRWGWWFAAITPIPFASLIGEIVVRRQLAAAS